MIERFEYEERVLLVSLAFVTYVAHEPDPETPGRVLVYLHVQGQADPLRVTVPEADFRQFLQRWEQFARGD